MKVRELGHRYEAEVYSPDGTPMPYRFVPIPFVKKIGDNFPGNEPPAAIGTNCQELLRIVINRVKYLDNQNPCNENKSIYFSLLNALILFEKRATRLKNITFIPSEGLEDLEPCSVCGHIFPHSHEEPADAAR